MSSSPALKFEVGIAMGIRGTSVAQDWWMLTRSLIYVFTFTLSFMSHAYLHGHNSASANDGKLAWTHISILSLWVHLKQRFPRGCQFLNVSPQMFLEISPSSSQGSQNFLSQLSLAAFIYWEPQPWAIIPALVFMLPTQTGKLVLFWGTEANTRH